MENMAEHFGITDRIEFDKRMTSNHWDNEKQKWRITLSDGEVFEVNAVVSCIGGLHVPKIPDFPGRTAYQGITMHSAQWDKQWKPDGRTVAVIGTGASAVQIIPSIAPKVKQLYVFQRTPCWTGEKEDYVYPNWLKTVFRYYPPAMYFLRLLYFWRMELIFFLAIRTNGFFPRYVKELLTAYIEKHVKDPELRKKLIPNYEVGCKRITPSADYIQTYNRKNVTLITEPIKNFTKEGIQTENGDIHKMDTIIYATGFDVLHKRDIITTSTMNIANQNSGDKTLTNEEAEHSEDGIGILPENGILVDEHSEQNGIDNHSQSARDIRNEWGDTPNAFLGMVYPNFPNLFYILGPGTGLTVGSLMLNLECQINYTVRCLRALVENNMKSIAVKKSVNDKYQAWSRQAIKNKAFAHPSCTSWYRNDRGVTFAMWPAQPFLYWWHTMGLDLDDYECQY